MAREDPEVSELVKRRFEQEGINVLVGHKAKQVVRRGRREASARASTRARACGIEFDALLCALGRVAEYRRLRARGARHSARQGAHGGDQRIPADALSEHLRLRRRRRPLPVHAHRVAPGLVRVGERAVRAVPEVPRRLLGDPVGDLHRARSGARRPERDRGAGARHRLRGHHLRHRRSRPRHRRRARRTAWSRC